MDTNLYQDLPVRWRRELDSCEQAAEQGTPRRAWIARIRARLYRFLLRRYGAGDWRRSESTPGYVQAEPTAPGSESPPSLPFSSVAPPRTPTQIQAALKGVIRQECPVTAARATFTADDWITVTRQGQAARLRTVCRLLMAEGIEFRLQHRWSDSAILVRYRHRDVAAEVVTRAREYHWHLQTKKILKPRSSYWQRICLRTTLHHR